MSSVQAESRANESLPLLEAEGIRKQFGGIHAIRHADLLVGQGEIHGLVGPNGCGKSTLLNVVSGNIRPDEGTVRFQGEELPLGHYRRIQGRGIVLVAQEVAIAPREQVWEALMLGSEPRSGGLVDRRAARRAAADALELLGHPLDVDAEMGALSPVDHRLVAIARGAVRPNVRLLILDEPTAGLPHAEVERVMQALRNLVAAERSLILVSHHIDEVVEACQTVTVMRDGRSVQRLVGAELTQDALVGMLMADAPDEEAVHDRYIRRTPGPVLVKMSNVVGAHLRGVSLEVRRSEVVGVAGILGSGVSEILEMVTGQRQPVGGAVEVGEGGATPRTVRRAAQLGVGYLTGDRSKLVVKQMTVAEHVTLPVVGRFARAGIISRRREASAVSSSLAQLDVKGTPSAAMSSLSGGNQQRALLARFLETDVDVLVVDQPTVGVDVAGRLRVLAALMEFAKDCAIVISAEADELAAICDRVICLRRGNVVQEIQRNDLTERSVLSAIA